MPPPRTEHSRYGSRETTEGLPPLLPELKLVGHVSYHTARPSFFHRHQHRDVLEIFYIVRGKVSWWVEGVCSEVKGNELFLIWPEELHGARDNIVEPSEYYWIQVDLPSLRRGAGKALARQFGKPSRGALPRHFRGAASLLPLYRSLLEEQTGQEPNRELVQGATLHLLLSLVVRYARTDASSAPGRHPDEKPLAAALGWARENLDEATVEELVRVSGLDGTRFRKSFGTAYGSTPARYLARLRLQHAKEQLARGLSVTTVSHRLGFPSSQYFSTVFRKYEGMSPTEFVERAVKSRQGFSGRPSPIPDSAAAPAPGPASPPPRSRRNATSTGRAASRSASPIGYRRSASSCSPP